jgi:hypothetical protein
VTHYSIDGGERERETQYKFVEVSLDNVDIRSEGLKIVKHFTSAEIASADDVLNLSRDLKKRERELGRRKRKRNRQQASNQHLLKLRWQTRRAMRDMEITNYQDQLKEFFSCSNTFLFLSLSPSFSLSLSPSFSLSLFFSPFSSFLPNKTNSLLNNTVQISKNRVLQMYPNSWLLCSLIFMKQFIKNENIFELDSLCFALFHLLS